MGTYDSVSFLVAPPSEDAAALSLTPIVNAILLTQLVESYEQERGYEPAGGYGGLIPSYFNYGPLEKYFMGQNSDEIWRQGYYLLGCSCGEVGCWPLAAQIEATEKQIVWREFRQPFRPARDYSSFGPFLFDREQYTQAVTELAYRISSLSSH